MFYYYYFSISENPIEITKTDVETMTIDDSRMDELEELLEQEKVKNSNLTSKFENTESCLKQQTDSNAQLSIQLKEKESVIEILRSSHSRSLDHHETNPVLIENVRFEERKAPKLIIFRLLSFRQGPSLRELKEAHIKTMGLRFVTVL